MGFLLSLLCLAFGCLFSLVLFAGLGFLAYRMMNKPSSDADDSGNGGSSEPAPASKPPELPKKPEIPDLPPPESLEKAPIAASDPFDEDEMATVVAPPSMELPPTPPPPPAPPAPEPSTSVEEEKGEDEPPKTDEASKPDADAKAEKPDGESTKADDAKAEEPAKAAESKPKPPPRSSGQTIIAFDDEEDF